MKLYRLYLPTRYNDGKEIEIEKLNSITEKIERRFDGCSLYPSVKPPIIQGIWIDKKISKRYEDSIVMTEVIVEDTIKNQKWFKSFKKTIKKELKQKEILIIVQYAEVD